MNKFEKYKEFSAVDFATDANFFAWVKCPDNKSTIFWKKFLEQYPSQKASIEKATSIVRSMKAISHTMDAGSVLKVWNEIEEKLSEPVMRPKSHLVRMKWWMAAACVVVLIAGYVLLVNKPNPSHQIAQSRNTIIVNDVLPGGNKATLTLADGRKILLDSAQNGNIAVQGNANIVKLAEGQIAYESGEKKSASPAAVNTVSTPRGGQYQLTLSDGTKVWLNAASSISFPANFSGNERNVSMTGEAYFEVAHNAQMPFRLTVNNVGIRVLGTHFNVNAYQDNNSIAATLFEGSIQLRAGARQALLKPGQQAEVTDNSNLIAVKNNIDEDQILAWKNGKFYFNNVDIHSIMNEVSRWYDVDITYNGHVDKLFGGTISRNVTASDLFKILEATGGVHFRIEGKKIIVSP